MYQSLSETDTLSLNYYKTERMVELIWKKSPSSAEFREVYKSAVQFASNHKVALFLSDMRNEGLINMEDLKWLENEIIPSAFKIGVSKIALITEESFYSILYAETLKKKLENPAMQVKILSDPTEAKTWLLQDN
jgi:hypothetical protein